MKAEERVANLIFARRSLTIPVDVRQLASSIATVEEDVLPNDADAVVLYDGPSRSQPTIVLAEGKAPARQRFTLAHEIGHLVIPWHIGTMACHTEYALCSADHLYVATEAEANRFASELLMPTSWVRVIAGEGTSIIGRLERIVEKARVSPPAASLKLAHCLPPGHVFVASDNNGIVTLASASPGTQVSVPTKGQPFDKNSFDMFGAGAEVVEYSGVSYQWWYFGRKASRPRTEGQDARALLTSIVAVLPEGERRTAYQRISGITAAVRRSQLKTAGELYAVFLQRFTGRDLDARILGHPEFQKYLSKRAEDLFSGRA